MKWVSLSNVVLVFSVMALIVTVVQYRRIKDYEMRLNVAFTNINHWNTANKCNEIVYPIEKSLIEDELED